MQGDHKGAMADCTEALKLDPKGVLAPDSGASEDPWTGVHSATESYVRTIYARTTREGHLRKLRMAEVATGSDTRWPQAPTPPFMFSCIGKTETLESMSRYYKASVTAPGTTPTNASFERIHPPIGWICARPFTAFTRPRVEMRQTQQNHSAATYIGIRCVSAYVRTFAYVRT